MLELNYMKKQFKKILLVIRGLLLKEAFVAVSRQELKAEAKVFNERYGQLMQKLSKE